MRRRAGWMLGAACGLVLLLGGTYALSARGGIVVRDDAGCPRTAAFPPSFTSISWIPLVRVDGTTYLEVFDGPDDDVPRDRVGDLLVEVRCSYGDAVQTSGYDPRDGEATFLPVGTPIHAVTGVDPAFEVVALTSAGPRLYRRDVRPDATTTGAEIVPLPPEQITGIALLSEEDGRTELGRLPGSDVEAIVEALRDADVEPPTARTYEEVFTGPRVFVALERGDLPALVLVVFVDPGLTTDGLVVPDALLAAVRAVALASTGRSNDQQEFVVRAAKGNGGPLRRIS